MASRPDSCCTHVQTIRLSGADGHRRRLPIDCGGAVAAAHEVRCAAETSPLTRLTSMTEVYLNVADPKLFEGIAELAAASDGNDIAILAFGDW